MTRDQEIAWLAGLIEGEGSIYLNHLPFQASHRLNERPSLAVSLKMTDKDVIERAMSVFTTGRAKIQEIDDLRPNRQKAFRICWTGSNAEAVTQAILPYMGKRRSAKIRECLNTPNLSHRPKAAC